MFDEQPNSKLELIQAIEKEYAEIAKIDQDAETVYSDVKAQLHFHQMDPIGGSPTSGEVQKVQYLAERYADRYGKIAELLTQLNERQHQAHSTWRGYNK